MTAFGEMVRNTTYVVQTPTCFVCGKDGEVEVPMEGFLRRQLGALIQDAYPEIGTARTSLLSPTGTKR